MKHEWQVFNVSGGTIGTIGWEDGNRLECNMPRCLHRLEDEGWEVFSVNIVSESRGYVVARRPAP